ncbi:MAG: DUF937 domain-containing protein [Saprospiraceae bacterium]|nr:DUF937 domain-containing protein [Saprospiraceae bacterium]
MNLIELVQDHLSDQLLDNLGQQIGSDRKQTQAAATGALSTIVAALSKNAARPGGLDALVSAVDRDHDGSILDDAMGFLTGQKQAANARMTNGSGILKHVLGKKRDNAADVIGRMSGLDKDKTAVLMAQLAPLIMGALGKARHQQGMGVEGIGELLTSTVKSETNRRQEMSLLSQFLDKDDDGSVMDDLVNMGMKAFFRRRRRR